MKYAIAFTETAQTDLSDIFRYMAMDLQSCSMQVIRLPIEKAIESLVQMPERHRVYDRKELA